MKVKRAWLLDPTSMWIQSRIAKIHSKRTTAHNPQQHSKSFLNLSSAEKKGTNICQITGHWLLSLSLSLAHKGRKTVLAPLQSGNLSPWFTTATHRKSQRQNSRRKYSNRLEQEEEEEAATLACSVAVGGEEKLTNTYKNAVLCCIMFICDEIFCDRWNIVTFLKYKSLWQLFCANLSSNSGSWKWLTPPSRWSQRVYS